MSREFIISKESSPEPLPTNPLLVTVNILSILGCLFNLLATFAFKSYRSIIGKMVLALLCMDLIANSTGLLMTIKTQSEVFCRTAAFFIGFGYGGSIFWSCCFAHSVYVSVNDAGSGLIRDVFKKYFVISLLASIIVGTCTTLSDFVRIIKEVDFCWHVRKDKDWGSIAMPSVLAWSSILYCVYCYASVMKKLHHSNMRGIFFDLMLYPLILVICYLPIALGTMTAFITQEDLPITIRLVINILFYSQGFWNALAYGLTGMIKEGIKKSNLCKKRKIAKAPTQQLLEDHTHSFSDVFNSSSSLVQPKVSCSKDAEEQ